MGRVWSSPSVAIRATSRISTGSVAAHAPFEWVHQVSQWRARQRQAPPRSLGDNTASIAVHCSDRMHTEGGYQRVIVHVSSLRTWAGRRLLVAPAGRLLLGLPGSSVSTQGVCCHGVQPPSAAASARSCSAWHRPQLAQRSVVYGLRQRAVAAGPDAVECLSCRGDGVGGFRSLVHQDPGCGSSTTSVLSIEPGGGGGAN
jgi:hypothetical protein